MAKWMDVRVISSKVKEHFFYRITILPPTEKLKAIFESFKKFHQDFMEKYKDDVGAKSAL